MILSSILSNEKFLECKCGSKDKAIFYCGKGCTENNTYCLICMEMHDHKPSKIILVVGEKQRMWMALFESLDALKNKVDLLFK